MKKILFVLAIAVVVINSQSKLFDKMLGKDGAYNDDGTPKIQLYTHSNCGEPCNDAISHLSYKDIKAEIFEVDKDDSANEKLKTYTRNNALPVLVVGSKTFSGFDGKAYNELLYLAVGESALGRTGKKVYKEHFNADGSPKVVMYSVSWCGYCKKAREDFNDLGIDFTEWDVEDNWSANDRYQYLESGGYPLIYVGTIRVGTFDEYKIKDALSAFDA